MVRATVSANSEGRRRPSLLPAAVVAIASVVGATPSFAVELEDILAASKVTPPARVGFREERHSPLFDEPLVLDGYLEYLGEGVLNKVIESPFAESFSIEDGSIRLQRDGETREVSLDRSRELTTIIGAIEAILAGEAARLESLFDIEVSGTIIDWSLALTPRSRRVGRQLSALNVSGNAESVDRIMIDLHDGEWQIMNMLHEAPDP